MKYNKIIVIGLFLSVFATLNFTYKTTLYFGDNYQIYYEKSVLSRLLGSFDFATVDVCLKTNDNKIKMIIANVDLVSDINSEIWSDLKISTIIKDNGGIKGLQFNNER